MSDKLMTDIFLLFAVVFFDERIDLFCWILNDRDGNIVVQGVDDHSKELTHISFHIIWFCEKLWGTVS